jgi:predicted phage baseplate assembly protein
MSCESIETCGACQSVDQREDATIANPPGRDELSVRIGSYGTFFERMKLGLARQLTPPDGSEKGDRPLAALTTRASEDPTIALLDAWACVAEVLTFYQERLANEHYLRTATERRSVLELARAIGYELDPGVAASVRLAFTLRDTPNAPASVQLAERLQVMSVPGQDELPRTFETIEAIEARPEWNAMVPRQTEPHILDFEEDKVYLQGTGTGLAVGDALLLVGSERDPSIDDPDALPTETSLTSERWDLRKVIKVEPLPAEGVTRITFDRGLGDDPAVALHTKPSAAPHVFALRSRANLFGYNAPDVRFLSDQLSAEWSAMVSGDEWADFRLPWKDRGTKKWERQIDLDVLYPKVVAKSWVVLEKPNWAEAYKVVEAAPSSRKDYSLATKTTLLTLDTSHSLDKFRRRSTVVHIQSEELTVAPRPMTSEVGDDLVVLDRVVPHLDEGRAVVFTGLSAAGEPVCEVAFIKSCIDQADADGTERTVLELSESLSNRYQRDTVTILGNVAMATEGKTVSREVLGSGNGAKRFQSFTLRQPPLTYARDLTGSRESTLVVRVNGVEWHEVDSFYGRGPDERVFVTRLDDQGLTQVTFGDGLTGARLPTGKENLVASYRVGLGREGEVDAGVITILKTKPKGVKSVTNPSAAEAAEDPEVLDEARANAPLTVLTLDRLVSVQDYEDYARAYPGVGKAQAVELWTGRERVVHLTIADNDGGAVLEKSTLWEGLSHDIAEVCDPVQRLRLGTFEPLSFGLLAKLEVDADFDRDEVEAAVQAALAAAFCFEARRFGQPVTAAEVVAVIHSVDGVVGVDLDALEVVEPGEAAVEPEVILPAKSARWEGGRPKEAELLTIDTDAVELDEMPSEVTS